MNQTDVAARFEIKVKSHRQIRELLNLHRPQDYWS